MRVDELSKLLTQGIVPPCARCPEKKTPPQCCDITEKQHVNSGSRAKVKSRFISTSENESVLAWYCANTSGNPRNNSATYVEMEIIYDENNVSRTCERNYGATANNRAKASCEVLIKDHIPVENILHVFRVKTIPKGIYDKLPNTIYEKNGTEFKKIFGHAQQKDKYMISAKVWSKNNTTQFNLISGQFPEDYFPEGMKTSAIAVKKNRTMKRTMTSIIQNDDLVGKRIRKKFDDGNMYDGIVTKLGREYYKINYDDGDSEDMTREEVIGYLITKQPRSLTSNKKNTISTRKSSMTPTSTRRKRQRTSMKMI